MLNQFEQEPEDDDSYLLRIPGDPGLDEKPDVSQTAVAGSIWPSQVKQSPPPDVVITGNSHLWVSVVEAPSSMGVLVDVDMGREVRTCSQSKKLI